MHFRLIACISSFIFLSLDWCAGGLLKTCSDEILSMPVFCEFSASFTLISAWNQMEWMEDEEGIVLLAPKVALAHTWPLLRRRLVLLLLFLVCDSTFGWRFQRCFHWGFHWSSPRRLPSSPAVYLESATASGESRGPFEACWLALLLCCLGRFFGGGVTQLCIVFYSLALLGVHPKFGSAESTK